MVNPDRGIYQPPPEDIQVYDPAADEEQERSRLPILILVALLVLAAFAGVVWLAYNQGVARGRADAPPIIAAQQGPLRTAPDAAQTSTTPLTGLKIYNQPVSPEEDAANTTEAAQPASQLPSETATPAPEPAPDDTVAASAPQVAAAPPAAPSFEALKTQAKPKPKAKEKAQVATAAPAALAPAASNAATNAAPNAAPLGGVLIQIGSYPSDVLAQAAWNNFQKKHADTLQGYSQDIRSFDLGAKGTWYRLRIGSFADKASALATCNKLKAEGAPACIIAAR